MEITIHERALGDIVFLEPGVIKDGRGFFMKTFREDKSKVSAFLTVQDNHSRSTKNVPRGLHFQWDPTVGKLMRVSLGSVFLVAVAAMVRAEEGQGLT